MNVTRTPGRQPTPVARRQHPWHSAFSIAATALLLSGCLLDGGVSGSSKRDQLLSNLEGGGGKPDTGALTSGGERESGQGSGQTPSTGSLISEIGGSTGGGLSTPGADFPGTFNYSVEVDLPSCDGPDALRITSAGQFSEIKNSNYRVFCIAPGDYRSAGLQEVYNLDGTAEAPRVIRYENPNYGDDENIFRAPQSDLAMIPPIFFRNSDNWVIDRVALINIDSVGSHPFKLVNSDNIIINRIRMQQNRSGIEFHHGTDNSSVQNSLIGDMDVDPTNGNDAVCVAFEGRYINPNGWGWGGVDSGIVVAKNNRVVNNEIYNCNDGVQLIWKEFNTHWGNFQGTVIAGNDIYIDNSRRSNCYGSYGNGGNCACTENAIDIKTGSFSAEEPVAIFDNKMWGWRKTDSNCNPDGNSWGTAVSTHFGPMNNVHMFENIIWDSPSGIALVSGAGRTVIRDNIITDITADGPNNGIGLVLYNDDYGRQYGVVSDVTVEGNHIVDTGGAWVSQTSEDSDFNCNVVVNGSYTSGNKYGSSTSQNAYYNTNSGNLTASDGSDYFGSAASEARLGQLCFVTRRATVEGGVEVCLDGVLSTDESPHSCGSDYWTTANWSN